MDPLLEQFHRQYLQQVTNLSYPSSRLLALPDIQQQIFRYFFDRNVDPYLPPPDYQRRVLKKLIAEIIGEAKDEDDEISDELMAHMGSLSAMPNQSDAEMAQAPRVLSYFIPQPISSKVNSFSFDDKNECNSKTSRPERILIRESPQLLAAGSNVGLRTWEACLRLAYFLCTSRLHDGLKGANVLELGAGTGLLSLICSLSLAAKNVVATDGLPHVVDGIEENIVLNHERPKTSDTVCTTPLARVLDWTNLSNLDSTLSIDEASVAFDYILGADITYHPELLDPLAALIANLKNRFSSSMVLISATVRNENTLKLWRQSCQGHGLEIREVGLEVDHWQCPQYRQQSGLFHEQAFPIIIMEIRTITKCM